MEIKTLNEQIERLKELIRKCYGAVAGKNGTVPEVGERNMENLPAAIGSIETPEAEEKEVNFYDYKGKRVFSYSASEAMALTELPEYTSPDTIVLFDRWSEDLEQVKRGMPLDVGAYCSLNTDNVGYTSNGKEWVCVIKIRLTSATIAFIGERSAEIDFGDGVVKYKGEEANEHTYPTIGEYIIKYGLNSSTGFINSLTGCDIIELYIGSTELLATSSNALSINKKTKFISVPFDYKPNNFFYRGINAPSVCFLFPSSGILKFSPAEITLLNKIITPTNNNDTIGNSISLNTLILPYGGNSTVQLRSLSTIIIPTTLEKITGDIPYNVYVFSPIPPNLFRVINWHIIHIPVGSLSAYLTATNWSSNRITYIEDIPTTINSFSITADDVAADATTTTIHVKANLSMGAMYDDTMVPRDLERDVTSDAFEANTTGQPRQVTISFTMLGETRTCIITQAGVTA